MTPLRVLQVVHGHPSERPGGAEIYAWELYQAMKRDAAFDCAIVTRTARPQPGPPMWTDPADSSHYWIHTEAADFDFLHQEARSLGRAGPWIDRLLRKLQPDVVHVQHTLYLGLDWLRRVRELLPNGIILHTLHDYFPICHHRGLLYKTRVKTPCDAASPEACHGCFPDVSPESFAARRHHVRRRLACVDWFIAPSRFLRDRFADWGLPQEKIIVEEYGRNPQPECRDLRIRDDITRFGYFGQIHPFKGVDVLLAAACRVRGRIEIQIHGANLELQHAAFREVYARLLSGAAGVVREMGSYSQADVPARMAAVDVVVVPSIWWENSPLVIQEAFAAGRPVIASGLGGCAEKVRDGIDGCHFRAGDPESLAAALDRATDRSFRITLEANIRPPHPMSLHLQRLAELSRRPVARRSEP